MKRRKVWTVPVIAAAAAGVLLLGYLLVRDGEEIKEKTAPTGGVATPTSSPPVATPESSPESIGETEATPVEGNSPSAVNPTPSPVSTQSLCPYLPSGSDPGSPQDLSNDSADTAIEKIPVLTVFAAAMHASGFDSRLQTASGVTILAPTDDAFAAEILEDELDMLLIERHGDLKKLLESHVIAKKRSLAGLVGGGGASSLSGDRVTFAAAGGGVRISDDANVICSDLSSRNATINVIDSVLGRIQLTEPQEEKG